MTNAPSQALFGPERLQHGSGAPLYRQLAAVIERAIDDRVLGPGDALLPERDIAQRCGVSRVTVRKALAGLVERGVLMQRAGSGSYVGRPHLEQSLSFLSSFSDDMRRRGIVSTVRWISRSVTAATPAEQAIFAMDHSEPVSRLTRLRMANGVPLAIECSVLPARDLPDPLVVADSLYAYLEKLKLRPVRATERLGAANIGAADAGILQIEPGAAVLKVQRTAYLTQGRAIEFAQSYFRGDVYDFVAELNVVAEMPVVQP